LTEVTSTAPTPKITEVTRAQRQWRATTLLELAEAKSKKVKTENVAITSVTEVSPVGGEPPLVTVTRYVANYTSSVRRRKQLHNAAADASAVVKHSTSSLAPLIKATRAFISETLSSRRVSKRQEPFKQT